MSTLPLIAGTQVKLAGDLYRIQECDLLQQSVTLLDTAGRHHVVHISDLTKASKVGAAPIPDAPALSKSQEAIVLRRRAHAMEAETGYRSGSPDTAAAGEPRPGFDPATTTAAQRRTQKEAELRAVGGDTMSASTLHRIARDLKNGNPWAGVDGRWFRSPVPLDVDKVEEAAAKAEALEAGCLTIHDLLMDRSTRSLTYRYDLIRDALRADAEWTWDLPSNSTLERWHKARFTKGELVGRASHRRSKTPGPKGHRRPVRTERLGEVVYVDCWPLDALLAGTGMEGWVSGTVIVFLEASTHSIVGLSVVDGAARALDVARCLLSVLRPKPMNPQWGSDAAWPYIGVPREIVAGASALPFVSPQCLVPDHGNEFRNYTIMHLLAATDIHVKPARKRRGSDKGLIEVTFDAIKTGMIQYFDEFRGSHAVHRGTNIEERVSMTSGQFEELLLHWAASVWQHHHMTGTRPVWTPEGDWSPARLYQAGLEQAGLVLRTLTLDQLLVMFRDVKVLISDAGIDVNGLTYDDKVLDRYRNQPDPNAPLPRAGGRRQGNWTVKVNNDDLRTVFWRDPASSMWHEIPWSGGAPDEVPFFGQVDMPDITAALQAVPVPLTRDEQHLRTLEVLKTRADTTPLGAAQRAAASRHNRQKHASPTPSRSAAQSVERSRNAMLARVRIDQAAAPVPDQDHRSPLSTFRIDLAEERESPQ